MKFIFSILLLAVAVFAHDHDDSHACAQPLFQLGEGKVSCLADLKRWYHDHSSGDCKEFSYDGCNKNENNFETKEDCDKVCAQWHEQHKDHHHGTSHGAHDHEHEHSNHDHAHHHHH